MNRISLIVLLIALLMVATNGCDESTTKPGHVGTSVDLSTPDNLVDSLERVLEDRDAAAYSELLNDASRDGDDPTGYKFYFTTLDLADFPQYFTLEEELSCMGHLFGGDEGESDAGDPIPSIRSIVIDLVAQGLDWTDVGGQFIEGDLAPSGTLMRRFGTNALVTLAANIGDSNINAWGIQDQMDLYLVPVDEGYRIWKCFDIVTRSTDDISWSEAKWLYALDYVAPVFEYLPYDSPDNLIENFIRAWENRDIAEYGDHILYDGEQLATDGVAYEPFHFYFGMDPYQTYPPFLTYAGETEIVGDMFAGLPGQDQDANEIPGILSIALDLQAENAWDLTSTDMVEGHDYPEGTQSRYYAFDMQVALEGTIDGTDIDAWELQDRLLIYVVPVEAAGGTEYRLWKWRDIILRSRSTDDISISYIKSLYLDRENP